MLHSSLDHLRAAESLFQASPLFFDSAGYLAHISVELLLKAWLLHSAGKFSGIHGLRDLYAELEKAHGAATLTKRKLAFLACSTNMPNFVTPNGIVRSK
ncbi:HEPN domain-containing protein [Propionivibrio sp.]|uniref:HEPN domain-containing protein n=1 Tax=Propionivibrio sp. TaxID=2212460 RepID=UPI003437217C